MVAELTERNSQREWNAVVEREAEALIKLPQIDCPVRHTFTPGIYLRTITMPVPPGEQGEQATIVIGAEHLTEHANIVHRGRALVAMDGVVEEIVAPYIFVSKPGVRKVLLILEEMEWSTVHANPSDTQDLAALESALIAPSPVRERYLREISALQKYMNEPTLETGGAR